jgi:hypothetical protein
MYAATNFSCGGVIASKVLLNEDLGVYFLIICVGMPGVQIAAF